MGAVALDASALIGLLEPTDAHHDQAKAKLRAHVSLRAELLLVASAYAEALVGPMRTGVAGIVEDFIEQSGTTIVPIGAGLAREAARLRAKHRSLRLGDALVLASAIEHDAELLTFDRRLIRIAREARP